MNIRNFPWDYVTAQTERMKELFNGLEHVRTHIGDLGIISNKSFEDHNDKLVKVLSILHQ